MSAQPVRTYDGNIEAAVCTAFDVTLRQRAEESWRARAAELEAVMAVAAVGVWFIYDPCSLYRRLARS